MRALALAGLLLACAVPAGAGLLRLAGLERRTSGRAERWLLAARPGWGSWRRPTPLIGLAGLFTPPLVLLPRPGPGPLAGAFLSAPRPGRPSAGGQLR